MKSFDFKEIASLIGISEDEIIETAKGTGLIDEFGNPTDFALNEGLLIEPEDEDWTTNN